MAEEELWDSSERALQAYGEPLKTVTLFKYLGWIMMAGDDTWTAVAGNLRMAWKSCMKMMRIMVWDGAYPRISDFLQGDRPGGVVFQVGDVGPDPLYGSGHGQLPS